MKAPPGFVPKRTKGGRRVFAIPQKSLDVLTVHLDAKTQLRGIVAFPNQFDCVRKHLEAGSRYFWKIDLRNAFDHVSFTKADLFLEQLPDDVRAHAHLFFHDRGGLIQGAPASPQIFQLFCQKVLDPPLVALCQGNAIVYTRFADDLLFSSKLPVGKNFRHRARLLIRAAGFLINERKAAIADTHKTPLIYLGTRFFKGRVPPTDTFEQELSRLPPGHRRNGKLAWKRRVLALNQKTD